MKIAHKETLGVEMENWDKYLNNFTKTKFFKNLIGFLKSGNKYFKFYPSSIENVFKPFSLLHPDNLKVVIITDTYYIKSGLPYGAVFKDKNKLLYENNTEIIKIEESFENHNARGLNLNFDLTLESWAMQGVLFLNNDLLFDDKKNPKYRRIWRKFNSHVLKCLNKNLTGIHYVFMGNSSNFYKQYIDIKNNYGYNVKKPETSNSFNCEVFDKINERIVGQNGIEEVINWEEYV